MKINSLKALAVLFAMLLFAGSANAEIIRGIVTSVAPQSKALTFQIESGKPLFIQWNSKTVWRNFEKKESIKPNDPLLVDLGNKKGNIIAVSFEQPKELIPDGITTISATELATIMNQQGELPVIADARPFAAYESAHIKGAVSIPLVRLEKRVFSILPGDKNRQIIFYDDGTGWGEAPKAAGIARNFGHKNIRILASGLYAWTGIGQIPDTTTGHIRKNRPALIDLRSFYSASKGYIPGAGNIQLSELKEKQHLLPVEKRVQLVLYAETDIDAITGGKLLNSLGYMNLAILYGGIKTWEDATELLEHGPLPEGVTSITGSHGGGLRPNELEQAVKSKVLVELVDVGGEDGKKRFSFSRALKIPLASLAKRMNELDRQKIQVVFASDPRLAEMAYILLKQENFRVNYVAGAVEFDGEDNYKVK